MEKVRTVAQHNDELQANVSVSQHCFPTTLGPEANRKKMPSVNINAGWT